MFIIIYFISFRFRVVIMLVHHHFATWRGIQWMKEFNVAASICAPCYKVGSSGSLGRKRSNFNLKTPTSTSCRTLRFSERILKSYGSPETRVAAAKGPEVQLNLHITLGPGVWRPHGSPPWLLSLTVCSQYVIFRYVYICIPYIMLQMSFHACYASAWIAYSEVSQGKDLVFVVVVMLQATNI